jgi:hypothetical protein
MDKTIDMAREAGNDDLFDVMQVAFLKRFEDLVRADEREACAKVFDGKVGQADLRDIAAFIRARGNT